MAGSEDSRLRRRSFMDLDETKESLPSDMIMFVLRSTMFVLRSTLLV